MNNWKTLRLGDVCDTNTSTFSARDKWSYINYLDTGNITLNSIESFQNLVIGVDVIPSRAKRKVGVNDILFSTVRPNQRHYGIIKQPIDNMVVSTGFTTITAKSELCNSFFVYYFLTRNEVIEHLQALAEQTVSTYPSIKASDIENLEVSLPSLEEQERIAGILGALDDKIECNNRINRNLEEQAAVLFRRWFVDFEFPDPDTTSPTYGKSYRTNGGTFTDSPLGEIPLGWQVGTLGDIANITMGQSPVGTSYNEEGNGEVFYQGRAEFGDRFPKRRLFTTEPNRMADENSILMSVRAPVGDINIAYEKCCIGRGLASINAKNNFNSFVLYTMYSLKDSLNVFNGEGTVFGNINKDSLREMKIIIPNEELITKFELIVSAMDSQIKTNFFENQTLATIRDTLLPKLMNNEI